MSVRVSFDVDRYSETSEIRVKSNDQVTKELERLSKFYKPENAGCTKSLWSGGLPWLKHVE